MTIGLEQALPLILGQALSLEPVHLRPVNNSFLPPLMYTVLDVVELKGCYLFITNRCTRISKWAPWSATFRLLCILLSLRPGRGWNVPDLLDGTYYKRGPHLHDHEMSRSSRYWESGHQVAKSRHCIKLNKSNFLKALKVVQVFFLCHIFKHNVSHVTSYLRTLLLEAMLFYWLYI